MVTTIKTIY